MSSAASSTLFAAVAAFNLLSPNYTRNRRFICHFLTLITDKLPKTAHKSPLLCYQHFVTARSGHLTMALAGLCRRLRMNAPPAQHSRHACTLLQAGGPCTLLLVLQHCGTAAGTAAAVPPGTPLAPAGRAGSADMTENTVNPGISCLRHTDNELQMTAILS